MQRIHSEAEASALLAQQVCRCGQRQFAHDPVLVDDGTLHLRFDGCASCHVPAYVDAALPAELEAAAARVAGSPRALDPDLLGLLRPWIETAFPRFAPPLPDGVDPSAAPIGPDWTIAEWLRGSLGYGQARCVRRDGVRALATFSRAQAQSLDRVTQKLKVSARGVVPMLDVRTAGDYAVLFEAEPPGLPLATAMFPLHVDVAAQLFGKLLEIVADAHQRGELLRGVRPETVYVGPHLTVAVAPRAELFAAGARQSRDLEPPYPFPAVYQPPDAMTGTATPASDVFSCCAVLLFMLLRKPPYDEPSIQWQIGAMMSGPPPLPRGLDPRLAELVRAGLDPVPAKRPSATELASALAAS